MLRVLSDCYRNGEERVSMKHDDNNDSRAKSSYHAGIHVHMFMFVICGTVLWKKLANFSVILYDTTKTATLTSAHTTFSLSLPLIRMKL